MVGSICVVSLRVTTPRLFFLYPFLLKSPFFERFPRFPIKINPPPGKSFLYPPHPLKIAYFRYILICVNFYTVCTLFVLNKLLIRQNTIIKTLIKQNTLKTRMNNKCDTTWFKLTDRPTRSNSPDCPSNKT